MSLRMRWLFEIRRDIQRPIYIRLKIVEQKGLLCMEVGTGRLIQNSKADILIFEIIPKILLQSKYKILWKVWLVFHVFGLRSLLWPCLSLIHNPAALFVSNSSNLERTHSATRTICLYHYFSKRFFSRFYSIRISFKFLCFLQQFDRFRVIDLE